MAADEHRTEGEESAGAAGAEDLPNVLPDLMYTSVLPILGPEAAERELERGAPGSGI